MSTAVIFIGMAAGAVGMGYLLYGRRQMKPSALLAGIGLCVYPFFVHQWLLMLLVGGGLMAVPFFFDD